MRKNFIKTLLLVMILSVIAMFVLMVTGCSTNKRKQVFTNVNDIIVDVFHDQASVYMSPVEPTDEDDVTIRIRVPRGSLTDAEIEFSIDVEKSLTEEHKWCTAKMFFEQADESGYYDYWVGIIPNQGAAYRYHFKLTNKLETVYYNSSDDVSVNEPFKDSRADFFVMPNYKVPDWSQGTVWYSMMPDGFYNGDILNDKLSSGNNTQNAWGNAHYGGADYFGGDLLGIYEKIEYMKNLGVESVFMNPIWTTTHQAGYGSFDFTQIDSAFGNDNMLKALINELHENDMRIMLDGVFQYFSSTGIVLNEGNIFPLPAHLSPRDPLYNIIMRDDNGNIIKSEWGSPYLDFSKKATRDYIYTQKNSVMQLYLREYGIDGWRMDVGNTLKGSDEKNWGTAEQILHDMRSYVKDCNSDALFLSEHAGLQYFTKGSLDAKWNYDFGWPVRDWAANKKNQSAIERDLFAGVVRLPRGAANASYNFLTTHDESRILKEAANPTNALAAQILTMTYLGSPCIFYGDEIGMYGMNNPGVSDKAPTSFSSMNWNRDQWDYEIYNLTRALTGLRREFDDVYRHGLYKTVLVDLKQNLLGFGRWYGNDKTITVTSQNENVVNNVTIDAKQLSIPDGTVMYDYLSGRSYVVSEGKMIVDIMPGGSVFVNKKTGNFVGMYEKVKIGNGANEVVRTGIDSFKLSGNGSLDNISLATLPMFNNGEISFKMPKDSGGSFTVQIRSDSKTDSAYYAIVATENNGVEVHARAKDGGQSQKITTLSDMGGKSVSIERKSNNEFVLSVDSVEVAASKATSEMPFEALAGFGSMSGSSKIESVNVVKTAPQLYADFESNQGSMFEVNSAAVNGGKLEIKDDDVVALAPTSDFSIKTKLSYAPAVNDEFAGLVARNASSNARVLFGRAMLGGSLKLVIGLEISGKITVLGSADNAQGDIYLQLQKTGADYTGLYSTDNQNWIQIEQQQVNANFSEIYAGMFCIGENTAKFDMFAFGNSDVDGASYGAHKYYGDINFDMNKIDSHIQYRVDGGEWSYCVGGIEQLEETEFTQFYVKGAKFSGFKADFTLSANKLSAGGYIGFSFGNAGMGVVDDGAFKFTIDASGNFKFTEGGNTLQEGKIDGFELKKQYRFVLAANYSGMISIYMGENPVMIVNKQTDYTDGFFSIFGEKAAYSVTSFNFFHFGANWNIGRGEVLTDETSLTINSADLKYVYGSILNYGVSDFILGANFQMLKLNSLSRSEAGIVIGSGVGKTPQDGGLYIGLNDIGTIFIKNKENTLASIKIDGLNTQSCYLIIVVQNNIIKIYIDNWSDNPEWSDEPVLEYVDSQTRGGAISVYGVQTRTAFMHLKLYGLKSNEDYKTTRAYSERAMDEPPAPEPPMGENFVTEDQLFTLDSRDELARFNKYSGLTSLEKTDSDYNGIMKINGTGNWNAGAAISAGKFENFELKYKMRTEAGGWGGAIINKSGYNYNHEVTGLLFFANTPGDGQTITCYTGGSGSKEVIKNANLTDGYLDVTMKVYGGKIYISAGGQTSEYDIVNEEKNNRKDCTQGYISFNAGNCVAFFRDISVRILNADGSYANA